MLRKCNFLKNFYLPSDWMPFIKFPTRFDAISEYQPSYLTISFLLQMIVKYVCGATAGRTSLLHVDMWCALTISVH